MDNFNVESLKGMLGIDFSWDELGNIEEGRKNLGPDMPVAVYRLFQYTLDRVLLTQFGRARASELLRASGFVAGRTFAAQFLSNEASLEEFISDVKNKLRELKIGILRLEKAEPETMELTLTISEDLDCSGLSLKEHTVCIYDEGFLAGILYAYTGKLFSVQEVDCWATGGRTCRFEARNI